VTGWPWSPLVGARGTGPTVGRCVSGGLYAHGLI
jgi:hypothetical protein